MVMGCAKDIVEQAGVARFWWSDFPLGHSAGKPHDDASQTATVAGALQLFDQASESRTTVCSEQIWSEDDSWQQDFMNIEHLNPEKIAAMQAQHEQDRTAAQLLKSQDGTPGT